MKIARFTREGSESYGLVVDDRILPASVLLPEDGAPDDTDDLITDERAMQSLKQCNLHEHSDQAIPLNEIRLLHPIARPTKIVCLGLNYRDHAREAGKELPKNPIIFMKGRNALTGPYDPIIYPSITKELDYEGELVVVMGKRGKRIDREEAMKFIAGYMIGNDVSARDIQTGDGQWTRGKTLDTFAPTGPWLTTVDEIDDVSDLTIDTHVNGERRQHGTTADMMFGVAEVVELLSQDITFEAGDLIFTGTPGGVGLYVKPAPRYLKPGDSVRVEISNLGHIMNKVVRF
jgi:2-keto-4-pentenoate hydratase/2-oxohepta-3-ene-1,7-dioic acid hydratase in catechol pathway